jgi:hypothetical protein
LVGDGNARNAKVIDSARGRADLHFHLTTTLGNPTGSSVTTAASIRERPEHGSAE